MIPPHPLVAPPGDTTTPLVASTPSTHPVPPVHVTYPESHAQPQLVPSHVACACCVGTVQGVQEVPQLLMEVLESQALLH